MIAYKKYEGSNFNIMIIVLKLATFIVRLWVWIFFPKGHVLDMSFPRLISMQLLMRKFAKSSSMFPSNLPK